LPDEVEIAVQENVMPTVSSRAEAQAFSAAAAKLASTVDLHVKVDTGMGRLGVKPNDALDLIAAIRRLPNLRVQGVYTHFSSAEDDARFSQQQAKLFRQVLRHLGQHGIQIPCIHANNSAAVLH
jgi:alanine racemase